jgi:HSP20 family protein
MPVTDVGETDAWIIEAELPGVTRTDVNVELRDSELIISGEIKEKEQLEANLHEGGLSVRVPNTEQAKPRQTEVKAA